MTALWSLKVAVIIHGPDERFAWRISEIRQVLPVADLGRFGKDFALGFGNILRSIFMIVMGGRVFVSRLQSAGLWKPQSPAHFVVQSPTTPNCHSQAKFKREAQVIFSDSTTARKSSANVPHG
jgi:hypothetical protein